MNIELKPITLKSKLIFIDGQQAGIIEKEVSAAANTLTSSNNKLYAWEGFVRWDGQKLPLSRITHVSKIKEVIEREIRIYERDKAARENPTIEEDGILGRLADKAKQGVKNVRDRALYAVGDDKSLGRLHHRLATAELMRYWQAYVGRKESAGNKTIGKAPTIGDLVSFLAQFGININPEELAKSLASNEPAADQPAEPAAQDEPEAPAAPEAPEKSGAMDKIKNLASKIVPRKKTADSPDVAAKKAALKAQMDAAARDDMFGESLNEDDEAAPNTLNLTFNPKIVFPKLADWFMDKGIMTVTRDGEVRTGTMGGSSDDGDGKTTDDKDELVKIGSKITNDGNYLDVNKLKERFAARRLDKADLDWLRKSINHPKELRNAMLGDQKTAKQVGDFMWAILGAIGQRDIDNKSPNVTASGVTVDIEKMSSELAANHVTGKLIKVLQDAMVNDKEDELIKLYVASGDNNELANSAVEASFGIIDAFLKSTVSLKKKK